MEVRPRHIQTRYLEAEQFLGSSLDILLDHSQGLPHTVSIAATYSIQYSELQHFLYSSPTKSALLQP
jgi:hypothetical protein